MRIHVLTLAIVLAAGCNAEQPAEDNAAAARDAAAPTTPPRDATPPPSRTPPETGDKVPSRFQGRYATDATACAEPAHESRLAIEASRIAFHESSGAITRVAEGPDEVGITAQLTGEGETREASYRFRLSDDGDTLTDVGNGLARRRCG